MEDTMNKKERDQIERVLKSPVSISMFKNFNNPDELIANFKLNTRGGKWCNGESCFCDGSCTPCKEKYVNLLKDTWYKVELL